MLARSVVVFHSFRGKQTPSLVDRAVQAGRAGGNGEDRILESAGNWCLWVCVVGVRADGTRGLFVLAEDKLKIRRLGNLSRRGWPRLELELRSAEIALSLREDTTLRVLVRNLAHPLLDLAEDVRLDS